ncbi:hypothetical protein ACFIJ5_11700 [Haloimpatiens sp. FM7330]|uniref:hypothetical protein n=1 Tax=Haloimpatiens sp. FM7330 TaxID=3298610 RepID=UPI00363CF3A4
MNKEDIEVLKIAKKYMENMNDAILKAAEYIQNEDYYKGMDLVINITDGLEWIIQLIVSRNDIYTGNMGIDEFTNKIKEIVEAFENQDYILIGDLLEYEIKPIVENYYNETTNLIEKLKK